MRNPEIWIFIFILGLLGLNWPFLEIFNVTVVSYLFIFWFLFILLVAFAVRKTRGANNHDV
ncbi:MAG TPA: hypothetical protein VFG09_07990 [Thermodesulfovibrionales bacterium]|nr:hypothetical protein [Thermodesulfovibrionales bacterium]